MHMIKIDDPLSDLVELQIISNKVTVFYFYSVNGDIPSIDYMLFWDKTP